MNRLQLRQVRMLLRIGKPLEEIKAAVPGCLADEIRRQAAIINKPLYKATGSRQEAVSDEVDIPGLNLSGEFLERYLEIVNLRMMICENRGESVTLVDGVWQKRKNYLDRFSNESE